MKGKMLDTYEKWEQAGQLKEKFKEIKEMVAIGYSPSLKEVRKAVNSEEVKEQLKELNVKECEFWIRDNYYPTNYYGVQ
jgi:hypothetical protein